MVTLKLNKENKTFKVKKVTYKSVMLESVEGKTVFCTTKVFNRLCNGEYLETRVSSREFNESSTSWIEVLEWNVF